MKESDIQTILIKKLPADNAVYELKLCKETSLSFDLVKEHQEKALKKCKDSGICFKIPDMPHFAGSKMRFDIQKPFDCFCIKSPAYIVVCFYVPHKKKICYFIDIDKYLGHKSGSDKKSINEKECKDISEFIIKL
jgi:penicillin-binding protein-related factor A (putative recombinase)